MLSRHRVEYSNAEKVMVKIAQTTIDHRKNRQSPGTCFKGSVSILDTYRLCA